MSVCALCSTPILVQCHWTLKTIDVDYCLRKGLRSFLRQIMPNASSDSPMFVFSGEFPGKLVGVGIMWSPICVAFKSNGWHGSDVTCGKALFQIVISRLAFDQAWSPAVTVDHDRHMIRIIERCRGREVSSATPAEKPAIAKRRRRDIQTDSACFMTDFSTEGLFFHIKPTRHLVSRTRAVQRFWYGWKM
jgi:hypothetical protein